MAEHVKFVKPFPLAGIAACIGFFKAPDLTEARKVYAGQIAELRLERKYGLAASYARTILAPPAPVDQSLRSETLSSSSPSDR